MASSHQKRASGVMEALIQTATQRQRSPLNATEEESDRQRSGRRFAAEKQRKDLWQGGPPHRQRRPSLPSARLELSKREGNWGHCDRPHKLRVIAMSSEGTRTCSDELSGRTGRAYGEAVCHKDRNRESGGEDAFNQQAHNTNKVRFPGLHPLASPEFNSQSLCSSHSSMPRYFESRCAVAP